MQKLPYVLATALWQEIGLPDKMEIEEGRGGINKSLPAAEESDNVLTFYWHIGQTNGKRGGGGVLEVNEKSQKDRGKCTYIYNSIFTIGVTGVLDHHTVSDSGPTLQTLQHSVILGSL